MFNLEERTTWDNVKLTGTFGFLGGYTAILSLLILGIFTNCMTGNVTRTGIALGQFNIIHFLEILFVFVSFIFGAYLSTLIFDKFGHLPVLLIEATLLILIGVHEIGLPLEAWLAAGAMGLQNALTTCVSWNSGKVRTTHVTGTSTDIGIALADMNFQRAILLSFLLGSYLTGAFTALFASRILGYRSFTIGAIIIFVALGMDLLNKLFKNNTQPINQFAGD